VKRALVLGLLLATGCAWSNRANRPVWNAFEEHLVPDGDTAFYASLPLTVPAGLVSILTDTFVVHPAQVVDDAWDDAVNLWDDVPWTSEYYSQLALLPFRALATPLMFVGSFLWRSCFDVDHSWKVADDFRAERHAQLLAVLRRIAAGPVRSSERELVTPPPPWSEELQQAFEQALARADASTRLALLVYVRRNTLPPVQADHALGLSDPDPVIRYEMLRGRSRFEAIPAHIIAELCDDPNEVVRSLARELWPRGQ
jgi:hypothetical protein